MSDDEHDGSTQQPDKPKSYLSLCRRMILLYGREICILFLLAATALAAMHKGPMKVRRSQMPSPFFPMASIVADFYQGQMSAAFENVAESDFSFIMYYAPWDAESKAVRWEFEKAAKFYHKQIYFAAINCWHPDGDCRMSHKISAYPVLILYQQHFKGVLYKGLREFSHMVNFLRNAMQPFTRIEKPAELAVLRARHDAVVVGYVQFQGFQSCVGYHSFYMAAMKALEYDSARDIGFALVTNCNAAKRFELSAEKRLQLVLWNETLVYPTSSTMTSKAMVNWIFRHVHQVTAWVTPPGRKSLVISDALKQGPSVMLFTPRNMFHATQPYYLLLKEVALEYSSCGNSSNSLSYRVAQEIQAQQMEHVSGVTSCKSWTKQVHSLPSKTQSAAGNNTCCRTVVVQDDVSMARVTRICDLCAFRPTLEQDRSCQMLTTMEARNGLMARVHRVFQFVRDTCRELLVQYNPFTHLSVCCHNTSQPIIFTEAIPLLPKVTERHDIFRVDDRIAAMLVRQEEQKCKDLRYGNMISALAQVARTGQLKVNVTEMACHTNKTLSFLAIDSIMFSEFAHRLGLDVKKKGEYTALVILDPKSESHYVMQEEFTKQNLAQFINDFHQGRLERHLRSGANLVSSSFASTRENVTQVYVEDVATDSFKKVVLNQLKDVILLYYTSYCMYCKSVSHVYLTVGYYLRNVENLTFARIDADTNDLPWEYTVDSYPSIIFFPASRKAESRVFSSELPITVPNLLHFILANVDSRTRLQLALQVCNRQCIVRARGETLAVTHNLLSAFRKILARLRFLQQALQDTEELKATCTHCDYAELSRLHRRHTYLNDFLRRTWLHLHRMRVHLQHFRAVYIRLSTTEYLGPGSAGHEAIVASYEAYLGERHSRLVRDEL